MGARGTTSLANPHREEKNMPITDIFSKRQNRLRGETPDVYQYEVIPFELRVQVLGIWKNAFGTNDHARRIYATIYEDLCHEYGVFSLDSCSDYDDDSDNCSDPEALGKFFFMTENADYAIDVVELSFRSIDKEIRENPDDFAGSKISPDEAIAELNYRFREHGLGYQYESGKIIRIDSEYLHSEAVKPALTILSDPMYEGANAEFRSAHDHHRAKRYKECLNDCLKAFESCIKSICDMRGWNYQEGDTISRLINIIFEKKLIPNFMQSYYSALRNTLAAGVPTLRNKLGGHGQGTQEVPVPEYIATYVLHLTASNILFLAQANENLT